MKTTSILIVALTGIILPCAQSATPTKDLRQQGIKYFRSVPADVDLNYATVFNHTLRFMYAYQVRSHRENSPIDDYANEVLVWLYQSVGTFDVGKGDSVFDPYADENLLKTGLEAYEKARDSFSGEGQNIWAIRSYMSASANLFAYLECAEKPQSKAKTAFAWLMSHSNSLIVAGGKGDNPEPFEPLPKPNPAIKNLAKIPAGQTSPSKAAERAVTQENIRGLEERRRNGSLSNAEFNLAKHRMLNPER